MPQEWRLFGPGGVPAAISGYHTIVAAPADGPRLLDEIGQFCTMLGPVHTGPANQAAGRIYTKPTY